MKKIAQTLMVAALVAMPFIAAPTVSATEYTCQEGYTGPNTDNLCIYEETQVCEVVNDNTVTIDSGNTQLSISGDGLSIDGTEVGDSVSGSATNSNKETFVVTLKNDGGEVPVCSVAKTTPAVPVKENGQVAPTQEVTPAALPVTSGDVFSTVLTVLAAGLAIGSVVLFLGVTAYRLFQS